MVEEVVVMRTVKAEAAAATSFAEGWVNDLNTSRKNCSI